MKVDGEKKKKKTGNRAVSLELQVYLLEMTFDWISLPEFQRIMHEGPSSVCTETTVISPQLT